VLLVGEIVRPELLLMSDAIPAGVRQSAGFASACPATAAIMRKEL
jgi:hypothetical protein